MQYQFRGSLVGTLDDLKEVVALAKQGRIKSIPTRAVPIAELNKSLELLRAGKVTGRLMITHS
jgi:D-arabinose 1-dehydrogenase-like Zn-dependent alcohol dehydrogenase